MRLQAQPIDVWSVRRMLEAHDKEIGIHAIDVEADGDFPETETEIDF